MLGKSTRVWPAVLFAAVLCVAAGPASAQTTNRSGIEGKITDASGALLPGVTVTISSPTLQGQLASVSDVQGEYRFTALPAGTYTVSFELAGFQTIKREGLRVSVGFVASLDVVMAVGQVRESVTVTGGGPVVDIRTTTANTSLPQELLSTVPTALSVQETIKLSPGIRMSGRPDVGGSNTASNNQNFRNYGSAKGGNEPLIDGVDTRQSTTATGMYYDVNAFEEVQIKALGNDAEVAVSGVNFVGILKSGSNAFHGRAATAFQTEKLQSTNIDDALRLQGITTGESIKRFEDLSGDLGGRIVRDRLWFYGAAHRQNLVKELIGYVRDPGPDGLYGTVDDVAGDDQSINTNYTAKLTGQLTTNQRMAGFYQWNEKHLPENQASAFSPYETTADYHFVPVAYKVEWTYTPTGRSMFNVMAGRGYYDADYRVATDNPSTFDIVTFARTGASIGANNRSISTVANDPQPAKQFRSRRQYSGSYTYFKPDFLGGDHELKGGLEVTTEFLNRDQPARGPGTGGLGNDYLAIFQNGVPFQIRTFNNPFYSRNSLNSQSGFIKDSWRLGDRLTLNLGIRFDRYDLFLPAQSKGAGLFSEALEFSKQDLYTWSGPAPRLAFSYALTKDKKTALKGTYGRFRFVLAADSGSNFNLNAQSATTYLWNDVNQNRLFERNELGNFVSTTGASARVLNSNLEQPLTDEFTLTLERELFADFSVRSSYVYKREFNQFQDVNPLRPFSAYTIPITRTDPGPDGLTGNADDGEPITYYDYNASFRGRTFEQSISINTPGYTDSYHNIEFVASKRLSQRWQMLTSYLATKRDEWREGIPQNPNAAIFPKIQVWESLFRISGSYLAPYDIQLAGYFDHQSGEPYGREVLFTSGLAQLSSVVVLVEPVGARTRESIDLLSLRVEKRIRLRAGTMSLQFDLFNALNSNAPTTQQSRSGPNYDRISGILPPRIARVGFVYSF